MTKQQLTKLISSGEDSSHQFKEDIRNTESLAAEMVAFSNSKGGTIFVGVKDTGEITGLSRTDIARVNQPILVYYAAQGLLPYHGLGSRIKRALEEWPDISFIDDREGCLFTATIHRHLKGQGVPQYDFENRYVGLNAPLNAVQMQIMALIQNSPAISYDELLVQLNKDRTTIMRNIKRLREAGILVRMGSRKTGYWEIR